MHRRGRVGLGVRLVVVLAALAMVAGACSKDDKQSSGGAPEDERATAAEVSEGLRKIDAIARDIAAQAGTNKDKASQLASRIEPQWARVEGTVKANDKDAYLGFEDNFALLENAADSGDAAKAAKGSAGVTRGVSDYLARYPG